MVIIIGSSFAIWPNVLKLFGFAIGMVGVIIPVLFGGTSSELGAWSGYGFDNGPGIYKVNPSKDIVESDKNSVNPSKNILKFDKSTVNY